MAFIKSSGQPLQILTPAADKNGEKSKVIVASTGPKVNSQRPFFGEFSADLVPGRSACGYAAESS